MHLIGITANREMSLQAAAASAADSSKSLSAPRPGFGEMLQTCTAPALRGPEVAARQPARSLMQENASGQSSTPAKAYTADAEATDSQEQVQDESSLSASAPLTGLQSETQSGPVTRRDAQAAIALPQHAEAKNESAPNECKAEASETRREQKVDRGFRRSAAAAEETAGSADARPQPRENVDLSSVPASPVQAQAALASPGLQAGGTQVEQVGSAPASGAKGLTGAAKKDEARDPRATTENAAPAVISAPASPLDESATPAQALSKAHVTALASEARTISAVTSGAGDAGSSMVLAQAGSVPFPAQGPGPQPRSDAGHMVSSAGPAGMPAHDEVKTLAASGDVLEIGIASGSHGWLRVRAELGQAGEVTASVLAASPHAADTLKKEMPAISAYLRNEQVGLSALTVNAAGETSATRQGSLQGAAMNADTDSSRGDSRRDAGVPAGSGEANTARETAETEWNWSGAGLPASLGWGGAGLPAAMHAAGIGSWLSVRV